MSGYALPRRAKADIFDVWSYIATDSENAADHVEQATYDACAFLAEGHCAAFPPGPHNPYSALLDADPLSELHYFHSPAFDRGRPLDCEVEFPNEGAAVVHLHPILQPQQPHPFPRRAWAIFQFRP